MSHRIILVTLLFILLVACSPAVQEPDPNQVSTLLDLPDYDLVPGSFRLSLIGALTAETLHSTGAPISTGEYGSNLAGMRHPGTNTTGNVGLRLKAITAEGTEAALLLEFSGDIGAGTHTVSTNSDLNPALVGAELQVSGQPAFRRNVSGVLSLDFINRRMITGSLNITLSDADGRSVTAEAAFHRLPFSPREEFSIQLTEPYQHVLIGTDFSRGSQGKSRFITLPFTIRQSFQNDLQGSVTIVAQDDTTLQPGEYNVGVVDSPVRVVIKLNDVEMPIVEGTVLFARTVDRINGIEQSIWQGGLTVSVLTPAGEVTLTAIFNHFDRY